MQKIRFGGDYNPEQWPAHVRDRDVEAYRRFSVALAGRIAERYSRANDPASGVVVAWHVNG